MLTRSDWIIALLLGGALSAVFASAWRDLKNFEGVVAAVGRN